MYEKKKKKKNKERKKYISEAVRVRLEMTKNSYLF